MTTLHLRLNLFGDERLGEAFVVGDLHPLDENAPSDLRKRLRNLAVVASDDYRLWTTVEVPPGRYLLDLALPSGDQLTRELAVEGDRQDESFESPSPHEWLTVQHIQGNVGVRSENDQLTWLQETIDRGGGSDSLGFQPLLDREALNFGPPPVLRAFRCWGGHQILDSIAETIAARLDPDRAFQRMADVLDCEPLPGGHLPSEDGLQSLTFSSRETRTGRLWPPYVHGRRPVPSARNIEQNYLLLQTSHGTHLVSLATPWFDIHHNEIAFEVLVAQGGAIATAVRDIRLTTVLGYLVNAAPGRARRAMAPAMDMLMEKMSNPLGAAAGAHVLLASETDRSEHEWHRWVENLCNRFPWLSDGAIAFAELRLEHQKTEQDVEEAFSALEHAYRHGVPFFTRGVRRMLDLLTLYAAEANGTDDRLTLMYETVSRLASRVNYRQPFTTVLLSEPEEASHGFPG